MNRTPMTFDCVGPEAPLDEVRPARWIQGLRPSALQRMLQSARPDLLSLALGLPSPEFFPLDACARAIERVLKAGASTLQYAPPLPALKSHVVELMRARGVRCSEAQVFLTAGAQQGMNLLAKLLLPHQGKVLVEEFTYTGFLQTVAHFEPSFTTVAVDPRTGIDLDFLERTLRLASPPALIYTIPEGHNPLGTRMTLEQRLRLVELARNYKIPVIEDDAYGFLTYNGIHIPPLRALEDNWILYIGSFSKILAPSLRTGWIVAPPDLVQKLSIIKEAADINTCPFSQRIISAYLDEENLTRHVETLRAAYRLRRDTMVDCLSQALAGQSTFAVPDAGLFLWVELAGITDTSQLLELAIQHENVAFVPGIAFAVNERKSNSLRLNFSHPTISQIKDGISRLARAVQLALH